MSSLSIKGDSTRDDLSTKVSSLRTEGDGTRDDLSSKGVTLVFVQRALALSR
jgi:hypothetical protein